MRSYHILAWRESDKCRPLFHSLWHPLFEISQHRQRGKYSVSITYHRMDDGGQLQEPLLSSNARFDLEIVEAPVKKRSRFPLCGHRRYRKHIITVLVIVIFGVLYSNQHSRVSYLSENVFDTTEVKTAQVVPFGKECGRWQEVCFCTSTSASAYSCAVIRKTTQKYHLWWRTSTLRHMEMQSFCFKGPSRSLLVWRASRSVARNH